MNLARALRIFPQKGKAPVVSFVGAGGKTSTLFQLAKELQSNSNGPVYVTATTHLGKWQTSQANAHIRATVLDDLKDLPSEGITLITGGYDKNRTQPINREILNWLHDRSSLNNIPLLIEADGSRQKAAKAPGNDEPPIPEFSDTVVVLSGLSVLGKPLTAEFVHRPELFSQLSEAQLNTPITPETLIKVLTHAQGGLKNIPTHARRIAFLNQADSPNLQSVGGRMAQELLGYFDSVLVVSLQNDTIQVFERCAGIVLAAGESTRFGSPKQLLEWKGKAFVWQVAETALEAGLWPVVVVAGFHAAEVESTLSGLPVQIVQNTEYSRGQSTSIKSGIKALPANVGSAVFLLADQPQIPVEVIRALQEAHSQNFQPIIAPLVLEERRANPVLFDRNTFADLLKLSGDVGGRAIFDKHHVEYLPWHDDILLFDVDKPEDYQRLKGME